LVVAPGVVPRVLADQNVRVPDLAVSCSGAPAEEAALADPVLLIEILSPSNRAETWRNVWAYTSIPSVHEILVVHSDVVRADLLRRQPDLAWPRGPLAVLAGDLVLESIGLAVDLAAVYAGSWLAAGRAGITP
jgi:Uma2 family endonuclease